MEFTSVYREGFCFNGSRLGQMPKEGWADQTGCSCLRMGIRLCKSAPNDSCRSGRLFCQVSAILKGGFDGTQAGICQIKCLLRNHSGHLLKVNFGEVRRAASLSLELRASPVVCLQQSGAGPAPEICCDQNTLPYTGCVLLTGEPVLMWSSRWEDTPRITHSGSGLFWRCVCFCNYFSH